jgi:large subunit ribosomal protein L30
VAKTLKITLVRSIIGMSPTQEATLKALGLRRIRQVVHHDDTPSIRGMIQTVPFAVQVSEGEAAATKKKAQRSGAKS